MSLNKYQSKESISLSILSANDLKKFLIPAAKINHYIRNHSYCYIYSFSKCFKLFNMICWLFDFHIDIFSGFGLI